MKRRAIEGAYLLAFLEKDKDSSFEETVSMIIQVTDTKRDGFMQVYQCCLDFLSKKIEWYKLKSSLRNVLADFSGLGESEIKAFEEKYLKQMESEYFQIKIRNENYLLEGKKFARIYNSEVNQKNQVKLHMSIVTDNIMNYDSIMFRQNKADNYKDKHYRPYFVEFISDYFYLEYYKELKLDSHLEDDKWIEIQFVDNESEKTNDKYISGTFLFSASPLKIGKRTIEIIGCTIPKKVEDFDKSYLENVKDYIFDITKMDSPSNVLREIFPESYSDCEITIFNVGQGNLNLIEMDNKKFLFDIGDSEYNGELIERKNKEKANNLIKDINPDCVILSHWDLDHILGITKMTDKIFEAYWIVPDISEKSGFSDGAKRLICFLSWYNRTKLISIRSEENDVNDTIVFLNDVFELGKGAGKTYTSKTSAHLCDNINSLNLKNNFGLVLKIKGKTEQAIFAGDCEYESFPKNFMTQYPDYIVAPHHGSKMIFNVELDKSKVKFAFISSGKNHYKCQHYGRCNSHPHVCHINFLEQLGYSVYQTALTSYYNFKIK